MDPSKEYENYESQKSSEEPEGFWSKAWKFHKRAKQRQADEERKKRTRQSAIRSQAKKIRRSR